MTYAKIADARIKASEDAADAAKQAAAPPVRRAGADLLRQELKEARMLLWAVIMSAGGQVEVKDNTILQSGDSHATISKTRDVAKGTTIYRAYMQRKE